MATPYPKTRTVLVTGAGSGIGRATAHAFADEGAHVVAVGRREAALVETAGHDPSRISPLVADLTAADGPETVVRTALDRHGRLDVLVNNAGIVNARSLRTYTRATVEPLLATNLLAPVLLTQAALPALEDSRGVIVNVTTSVGQRGWPGNSLYAAGKAALEVLTRSWAVELAPLGIRVAAVAPGAVDTPIGDHAGHTPSSRPRSARGSSTTRRSAGSAAPRRWRGRSPGWRRHGPRSSPAWSLRWTAARSSHDTGAHGSPSYADR